MYRVWKCQFGKLQIHMPKCAPIDCVDPETRICSTNQIRNELCLLWIFLKIYKKKKVSKFPQYIFKVKSNRKKFINNCINGSCNQI